MPCTLQLGLFDRIPVRYMECSLGDLPRVAIELFEFPSPFVCSIAVREFVVADSLATLLRNLLERGAKYLQFAGPCAEHLHDLADQLRDEVFPNHEIGVVMTTWQTEWKPIDIIFDFLFSHPEESYVANARLMISTDASLLSVLRRAISDSSILY